MVLNPSPPVPTQRLTALCLVASALAASAAGFAGCSTGTSSTTTSPSTAPEATSSKPTLRLYLLSTVAGALEPCGCSKDQLGGADHLAAFFAKEREIAPTSLVVGAGPLFFQEPQLDEKRKTQNEWKAEALARAMKTVGLAAWAPAANDWAGGAQSFAAYRDASGAAFVAANVAGEAGLLPQKVVEVGGLKVAFIGLSDPIAGGAKPDGITVTPPKEVLTREIGRAKEAGANVIVGLASIQRGEALRLLDEVQGLNVLVVGKAGQKGDTNDQTKVPELVGTTLVVEAANHLQTVSVVDLFVADQKAAGQLAFSDGGAIKRAEEIDSVNRRIRDLEIRINGWEKSPNVDKVDLGNRKKELEALRGEKMKLDIPLPPPGGNFFRYANVEVREKLGADPDVSQVVLAYYKRVNDHNKVAFKDRLPEPPEKGKASFVGTDECSTCHKEERAVWDKTDHAKAYATLEKQFVEYNLECVGCHVTGYDRPGGSTVTHVEKLKNVGCETCHGAGSLHVKSPTDKSLIRVKPDLQSCVSECHHPPHVEGFDPAAKVALVLGKGHGM